MPDDEDFAAELAAAIAETADEEVETEEVDEEVDEEQETEETDEAADDADEDDRGDEDEEDLEDEGQGGIDAEAAAKAFEAGDLEAGAKALGLDPEVFDLDATKFKAARKMADNARKRDQDAADKLKKAETVERSAQETYGPIVLARKAQREQADGWQGKVLGALEMFFGDLEPLKEALGATGGEPAEETEVDKLRRELRERDRKADEAKAAAEEAEQIKAHEAEVLAKLEKTPLAGKKRAAAEIVRLVRGSYDPATKGYGMTVKEAYRQVKEDFVIGEPAKETPGKKKVSKKRVTSRRRDAAPKKELTEEEEFAAEVAAAAREAEQAERAARRRGRR